MINEKNYRVTARFRWLGSPPKADAELYLTVCGIERCEPDKFYGPTVRDDYHVHFILQGKGTLEINGKNYHLHRGQIFVIPPDIETYYYADPSDPWHYTWVSFAGTQATYLLEKAGITAECPVRDTYIEPEVFLALTEQILDHHEITISNELIRTALMYQIVAKLIETQTQQLSSTNPQPSYDYSPDVYVECAVEYIHYNYAHISVSDIASYIGITRSYLAHIFKQKLQISPQQYLVNYRLEQAGRLLRTTNLPVQEISEKVGYSNPLTFSKIFKATYKLSPKNYRLHIMNEAHQNIPKENE
ncbi:MAG: AraC family transcriptional regulator [Oliverpabstia sp.]